IRIRSDVLRDGKEEGPGCCPECADVSPRIEGHERIIIRVARSLTCECGEGARTSEILAEQIDRCLEPQRLYQTCGRWIVQPGSERIDIEMAAFACSNKRKHR